LTLWPPKDRRVAHLLDQFVEPSSLGLRLLGVEAAANNPISGVLAREVRVTGICPSLHLTGRALTEIGWCRASRAARSEKIIMLYRLFDSVQARRGDPEFNTAKASTISLTNNIEAEALGFLGTFARVVQCSSTNSVLP
jgi:hypothetical protein